MARGEVAAGHPETAEAGAWALREGGNAVDAAVAAICASIAAESPLTGLGAGGYMLVHRPGRPDELLDFFVAAPDLAGEGRRSELIPVDLDFGGAVQVFNIGAASCGVPGVPAGLVAACERYGTMPLSELVRPAVRLAREGVAVGRGQAHVLTVLAPVLTHQEAGAAIYAPAGSLLREGQLFHWPELAVALERLGADGAEPFYRGEVGAQLCEWVAERGGPLGPADLAAYGPVVREPVRARYRGRDVLTNPPPSSGGILIAYVLRLLERLGRHDLPILVAAMEAAQAARTEGFLAGLYEEGYDERFLRDEALEAAAARCRSGTRPPSHEPGGDTLGSTTHISVVDGEGSCASVTCSNGSGSGLVVPGTGVHLNNMLGEQDLNPFGFHTTAAGRRMPSMMAPTVVLREGELELALGSGGSNRIRSAIVQSILRIVADGMPVAAAVEAPRIHFEEGVVQAEPGVADEALAELRRRGYRVQQWRAQSLYFGGVHAVARDAGTLALSGGGDPRRGGAVAAA